MCAANILDDKLPVVGPDGTQASGLDIHESENVDRLLLVDSVDASKLHPHVVVNVVGKFQEIARNDSVEEKVHSSPLEEVHDNL